MRIWRRAGNLREAIALTFCDLFLRAFGCFDLARCLPILPAIPRRRFALITEPLDPLDQYLLSEGHWWVWDQDGPLRVSQDESAGELGASPDRLSERDAP